MSASPEVRRFLMRQDGVEVNGRQTYGVPAQRTGGTSCPRVSDAQVRAARVAVASGSRGEEDCAQLLAMLGLTPDDDGIPPVQR